MGRGLEWKEMKVAVANDDALTRKYKFFEGKKGTTKI